VSAASLRVSRAVLRSPGWLTFGALVTLLLLLSWSEIDSRIDELWQHIRPVATGRATDIAITGGSVEFSLSVTRNRACTFTPPPYGYLELPGGSRAVTGIAKISGPAATGVDYPPGYTYHSGTWRIGPIAGSKAAVMTVRYLCDGKPVFVDLVKINLE
jgi:hypothetical protein